MKSSLPFAERGADAAVLRPLAVSDAAIAAEVIRAAFAVQPRAEPPAVLGAARERRLDRREDREGWRLRRLGRAPAACGAGVVAGRRRRAPCRARVGPAGMARRGAEPPPSGLRGRGAGAGPPAHDAASPARPAGKRAPVRASRVPPRQRRAHEGFDAPTVVVMEKRLS